MKNLIPLLVAALLLAVVAAVIAKRMRPRYPAPQPRRPLTTREQAMYWRLQETFPEHVVLAQVAFSALLTSRHRGTRNTFDRKVADFVLCDKAFTPVAVIEIDDASHSNKRQRDAARDAMLQAAGYHTARFDEVPDADAARRALPITAVPPPEAQP